MGLGTKVRLSRLFSHPSGRLFGGAVDHFVGYGNVRQGGLADLPGALAQVMAGKPDYVTIQPGAARNLWSQYAGKAALGRWTAAFSCSLAAHVQASGVDMSRASCRGHVSHVMPWT